MIRPRKKDRHLPPCMYQKHGSYWLVKKNRWINLGSNLPDAMQAYADTYKSPVGGGLDELLDKWLAQTNVKASTLLHYKNAVNSKIKPAFAEFAPHEVKPGHVAEFLQHHSKHPNMANRMRSILKMAFDKAVLWGMAETNPVASMPKFAEKKRTRFLSYGEYQAIYNQADDSLKSIMELCYYTGQRIGDVLSIKVADVSDDGIFIIQQKTGKRLIVAMTPELKRATESAKRSGGNVRGLYLLGQRNGKPWSYYAVRDKFREAAERAGIKDAKLHDLRAMSITEAKRQGLDAQMLAGHTSPSMTERYIRDREIDVAIPPSFRQKA